MSDVKNVYDYTEGVKLPERPFLSNEEYGKAIRATLLPCTDCLILNKEKQIVFFPVRIAETGAGYWFIGGVIKAQVEPLENLVNCFKRETGLEVESKRFKRINLVDGNGLPVRTLWPTGRNDMHFIFYIELTPREIKKVEENLDPQEYDKEAGLREFTLPELKQVGVRDIVIDAVELAFRHIGNIEKKNP